MIDAAFLSAEHDYLYNIPDPYGHSRTVTVKEFLVLDDEHIEKIQSEYGCEMQELDEFELFDILRDFTDRIGGYETAKWDADMEAIEYTYEMDESEDY